ncbi:MAG: hypothetical protein WAV86_04085 [Lutibacter sp.]
MESNNINEIFEIDSTVKKMSEKNEINTNELFNDENRLKGVADFILVLGIISAIIVFFTTTIITNKGSNEILSYDDSTIFVWTGFVSVITVLLFSIGVWAFLRVISNISITLKEIKNSTIK